MYNSSTFCDERRLVATACSSLARGRTANRQKAYSYAEARRNRLGVGSFVFLADLVREINEPIVVDFITTSSYEHSEISTGKVNIISDLREDIEGKDVLIVDDIMDSGNTLKNIKEYLLNKNPKSIKTCVMLDKPCRREVDIVPDYFGFEIEDWFIVGYGLNYGNKYRNIPYIFSYED